ncbi:MAG: beta-ketoacyl synthase [Deltaproteobacteria bacterium]|nr:MAG: beta-ketoacyl synthase [Deltaproteobacteria bacterium]
MRTLPVIVGFGGANPAGRSSFHHAFMRTIYGVLPAAEQAKVRQSLARMMGIPSETPDRDVERQVLDHTLIRTIEPEYFDTERLYRHKQIEATPAGDGLRWTMDEDDLPTEVPSHWRIERQAGGQVGVEVLEPTTFFVADYEPYSVRAGGLLPSGFNPGGKHRSKTHPRGLQLAVYAASAAVRSVGIPWQDLLAQVPGDQVAVYASSAMGQLDWRGAGQMLSSHLLGKFTSSRNCPFGLPQMPADFVNAYVVGSIGRTGGLIGACATFLYNLEKAVRDIQLGIVKLAVVGAAEAPVIPEVIEGYRAMSALAEDPELLELDGLTEGPADHRRASRPFAENCGFIVSDSGQYVVLMADDLALEQGATIYGAVPEVYIHADGAKTSISSPGIGNYITLGKACALAAKILGEDGLRHHTFLHAHGTSTPQNRVTESHVFDKVAAAFDINDWVTAATKCFVGHSLGAAAGDSIAFALGTLATGWIPGVVTATEFASDIHDDRLSLSIEHRDYPVSQWHATFINSKGFGGNNATGVVLSPGITEKLLEQRVGADGLRAHRVKNEAVQARQRALEDQMLAGTDEPIYDFGANVMEGDDLTVGRTQIDLPSFPLPVSLDVDNPFGNVE